MGGEKQSAIGKINLTVYRFTDLLVYLSSRIKTLSGIFLYYN